MANINKNHIMRIDVANATLNGGGFSFYITDKNTSNLFVELVVNASNNPLIGKFVAIEQASDYMVTLVMIKPDKEILYIDGELLEEERLFHFNFSREELNQIGAFKCEFRIKCVVNGVEEVRTTAPFGFDVLPSIVTDLDGEAVKVEVFPIYEKLLERLNNIEEGLLVGYATEAYVNEAIEKVDLTDEIKDYARKEELPVIPKKVSAFENDKGYLTEQSLDGYATEIYVDEEIKKIDVTSQLTDYARKSELPTKTSQLTNDSNFLTSVPSEYITETELNAKGYLTEHQDISNKADKSELHSHSNKTVLDGIASTKIAEWDNKSTFSGDYEDLTNKPTIPTVPTNISAFTNDSGYLTSVPTEYVTDDELTAKGYATTSYVNNLSEDINELSVFVTPQMFGAKADGVTDDTDAINQAIENAGDNGTVYFPGGTYLVSSSMDSSLSEKDKFRAIKIYEKENLTLKFSPKAHIKHIVQTEEEIVAGQQARYYIIGIAYSSNIQILGGIIEGEADEHIELYKDSTTAFWWQTDGTYSRAQGHGIDVRSSDGVLIQGCEIFNCFGDSILVGKTDTGENSKNTLIEKCILRDSIRQGISVTGADNTIIRDCEIYNIAGCSPQSGIDFEPNTVEDSNIGSIVEGCHIHDCAGASIIHSKANKGAKVRDCRLYGDVSTLDDDVYPVEYDNCDMLVYHSSNAHRNTLHNCRIAFCRMYEMGDDYYNCTFNPNIFNHVIDGYGQTLTSLIDSGDSLLASSLARFYRCDFIANDTYGSAFRLWRNGGLLGSVLFDNCKFLLGQHSYQGLEIEVLKDLEIIGCTFTTDEATYTTQFIELVSSEQLLLKDNIFDVRALTSYSNYNSLLNLKTKNVIIEGCQFLAASQICTYPIVQTFNGDAGEIYVLNNNMPLWEEIGLFTTSATKLVSIGNVTSIMEEAGQQDLEELEAELKGYTDTKVGDINAQGIQQTPLFANTIDECTDTSKVYVLPDGYIYGSVTTWSEAEPLFTERMSTSIDTDGNIFNGTGYILGYKLGSDGTLTAQSGTGVTGFIKVSPGDKVYLKNISKGTANNIYQYDSSFNKAGSTYYWDNLTDEGDGVYSRVVQSLSTIAYIRFNTGISAETLISVNEPIAYSEPTSTTEWKNTGHSFVDSDIEIKSSCKVGYATCSTEADVAEKILTIADTNWTLEVGSMITVEHEVSNTASNVTLNVNGTGAYPIMYNSSEYTSTSSTYCGHATRPITYLFNGTHWVWLSIGYYPTIPTNPSLGHGYGTCTTAEETLAKECSISSYTLTTGGSVSIKFTNAVPANSTLNIRTRGAKAIYYRGAPITDGIIKAGDTATFVYSTYYHLISIDRDETFSGDYNDLTNVPTIPTKVSQLTNDSNYLTSVPSEYVTDEELNTKGYATTSYVQSEIAKVDTTVNIVDSVEEMEDTNKQYVYSGTNTWWKYKTTTSEWIDTGIEYNPGNDSSVAELKGRAYNVEVMSNYLEDMTEYLEDMDEYLEAKIDGEEISALPQYWITCLESLHDKINTIQMENGADTFQFLLCSDIHGVPGTSPSDTTYIGEIGRYMMDKYNIPFFIVTGDIMSQSSHANTSAIWNEYDKLNTMLLPIENEEFLAIRGNHDGVWGSPTEYNGVADQYYHSFIGHKALFNAFMRRQTLDSYRRVFGHDGSYFYIDYHNYRIYMLNTHTFGDDSVNDQGQAVYNGFKHPVLGSKQLQWAADTLNTVKDNQEVIFMAHAPLNYVVDQSVFRTMLNHYIARSSGTATATLTNTYWGDDSEYGNTTINVDFTNAKGTILGWFNGHIHKDTINTSSYSMLPMFSITCAGGDVRDTYYTDGTLTRTKNTATETAIDLVTITSDYIYFIRIGSGYDRVYNRTTKEVTIDTDSAYVPPSDGGGTGGGSTIVKPTKPSRPNVTIVPGESGSTGGDTGDTGGDTGDTPTTGTDGIISVTFQENTRLSSSTGNYSTQSGIYASSDIEVENGDVIRIYGMTWKDYPYIALYDSDNTYINLDDMSNTSSRPLASHMSWTKDEDDTVTITIISDRPKMLRFCAGGTTDISKVIVTRNMEIEEDTGEDTPTSINLLPTDTSEYQLNKKYSSTSIVDADGRYLTPVISVDINSYPYLNISGLRNGISAVKPFLYKVAFYKGSTISSVTYWSNWADDEATVKSINLLDKGDYNQFDGMQLEICVSSSAITTSDIITDGSIIATLTTTPTYS